MNLYFFVSNNNVTMMTAESEEKAIDIFFRDTGFKSKNDLLDVFKIVAVIEDIGSKEGFVGEATILIGWTQNHSHANILLSKSISNHRVRGGEKCVFIDFNPDYILGPKPAITDERRIGY